MSKESSSFLGIGWAFPPAFPKGKRSAAMVSEEEDIQESLRILLTTTVGERFLQPTYGCDLRNYLFEPLDTALEVYLEDLIRTAILYHEPRIKLDGIDLSSTETEGVLRVEIQYTIRGTNSRRNFVYPFYRDEGTEVAE